MIGYFTERSGQEVNTNCSAPALGEPGSERPEEIRLLILKIASLIILGLFIVGILTTSLGYRDSAKNLY